MPGRRTGRPLRETPPQPAARSEKPVPDVIRVVKFPVSVIRAVDPDVVEQAADPDQVRVQAQTRPGKKLLSYPGTVMAPDFCPIWLVEMDIRDRVELEIVRRGTCHIMLFIKESKPPDVYAAVEVVPAVETDPVSAREIASGGTDTSLPERIGANTARLRNLRDHECSGRAAQPQVQVTVVLKLDGNEGDAPDLPGAEFRPFDAVVMGVGAVQRGGTRSAECVQIIDRGISDALRHLVTAGV